MMYDLELLAKMELKLELTYLKMLKISLVVNRRDKIKNEYICGTAGSSDLETRLERQGCDISDMCRGGTADILDKRC